MSLSMSFPAFAQTSEVLQDTHTITATVKGMVCDFCARAVEKVFKKEAGVTNIDINLAKGTIIVQLANGQDIDDVRVKKLITDSGYSLVAIERSGT